MTYWWLDKSDVSVVETYYTSYAVIRTCDNFLFGLFRQEAFAVIVKDPNASTTVINAALAILQSKVPNYDQSANLFFSNRGGSCPYNP